MLLLQFTNITILFFELEVRNIITLKSILKVFELASSLKAKFFNNEFGGFAWEDHSHDFCWLVTLQN